MSKKQLYPLFFYGLIPWTVGLGLLPLLPVYATEIGAGPALGGYYLGFVYFALMMGSWFAGWLSDRLGYKLPMIVAGVLFVPTAGLMGRVANIWQLTVLTAGLWFLGGFQLTLTRILAGLSAGQERRGRTFGILALNACLGQVIGGLAAGPIVDRWGFPTLFVVLGLYSVLAPGVAALVQDVKPAPMPSSRPSTRDRKERLGKALVLLLVASFAATIPVFVARHGGSLSMKGLGFTATAISMMGPINAVVSLPVRFLGGRLSDRLGRKRLMMLGYLGTLLHLLVLAGAVSLGHFAVASGLAALATIVEAVGPAWVTDLAPSRSLGSRMSLFTAITWGAGIPGFAVGGYTIEHLGIRTSLILSACLPLASILLLLPVHSVADEGQAPQRHP